MCCAEGQVSVNLGRDRKGIPKIVDLNELLPYARFIRDEPEVRRTAAGFIGYGMTRPGDRVLFAVDSHYEPLVVEAMLHALREKGARVDLITVEAETDREFDDLDEIKTIMRRRPWWEEPRRWEGIPWIEELALKNRYDLLIHGKGGGIPDTPHRYEAFPWLTSEHFASKATVFPRDVHTLINTKTWNLFWEKGRGGKVQLTDPEGTELTWTLWEEYFDGSRRGYTEVPWWGHLMGHAPTPIIKKEDATGIVSGTTCHFARPFPQIKVTLQDGRVEEVEGGGKYGDAWRGLLEETKNIQYPCFPRTGLFWLWETAIGTNPKILRPSNIRYLSSGGFEWERRRSGIIHVGLGTRWRGPEEKWAGENSILYGHLHVHLLFPTMDVTTKKGETIRVIDRGRLSVLDDPEVRRLAARCGDPDEILKEDWTPKIPGISAPGSHEEYARDPAVWIYGDRAEKS